MNKKTINHNNINNINPDCDNLNLNNNIAACFEAIYSALCQKAIDMRANSYCPYSHFAVGAALLTKDGRIYTGCNIENAAFTPTNCAERTAFFKAISEGCRDFSAIAIAGGPAANDIEKECAPCGVCRQVMMEFCDPDNFEIILAGKNGSYRVLLLKDLLPLGFGAENLSQ